MEVMWLVVSFGSVDVVKKHVEDMKRQYRDLKAGREVRELVKDDLSWGRRPPSLWGRFSDC